MFLPHNDHKTIRALKQIICTNCSYKRLIKIKNLVPKTKASVDEDKRQRKCFCNDLNPRCCFQNMLSIPNSGWENAKCSNEK